MAIAGTAKVHVRLSTPNSPISNVHVLKVPRPAAVEKTNVSSRVSLTRRAAKQQASRGTTAQASIIPASSNTGSRSAKANCGGEPNQRASSPSSGRSSRNASIWIRNGGSAAHRSEGWAATVA